MMDSFSGINGFWLPSLMALLKVLASRRSDGRKNFSASSCIHCFLRLDGVMMSILRSC